MADEMNNNGTSSVSPPLVLLQVSGVDTDSSAVLGSTIAHDIQMEDGHCMYANIMIITDEWQNRLQDLGCSQAELKVKRYKGSNIAPYGPKETPIYYYNLTSIAIDYLKSFKKEKDVGRGWTKVPKNLTDIKTKIVERLLAMQKYSEHNKNTSSTKQDYYICYNKYGDMHSKVRSYILTIACVCLES